MNPKNESSSSMPLAPTQAPHKFPVPASANVAAHAAAVAPLHAGHAPHQAAVGKAHARKPMPCEKC